MLKPDTESNSCSHCNIDSVRHELLALGKMKDVKNENKYDYELRPLRPQMQRSFL